MKDQRALLLKLKKATSISVEQCGNPSCNAPHLVLWRGSKPFANAILKPEGAALFCAQIMTIAQGAPGAGGVPEPKKH